MHPRAIPPSQEASTVHRRLEFSNEKLEFSNEKLERELWLLRSTVEYHDACGFYPFSTVKGRQDFSRNWVNMTPDKYQTEYFKMKRNYNRRLKKNYQDLVPRVQEALEMGNKIWNSRDAPMLSSLQASHNNAKEEEEEGQDHTSDPMLLSEEYISLAGLNSSEEKSEDHQDPMLSGEDHNNGKDVEKKEEHEELWDRFPLLKSTFKFGPNISDDGVEEDGLVVAFGSHKRKQGKRAQVKELEVFLKKIDMIRKSTLLWLDQIKNE